MSLVPPTDLKVLANDEFKELIVDMVTEIQRLNKLATDLGRVRSIVMEEVNKQAPNIVMGFFMIKDSEGAGTPYEDSLEEVTMAQTPGGNCPDPPAIKGIRYPQGIFFNVLPNPDDDKKIDVFDCEVAEGIDIYGTQNNPNIMPENAEILSGMRLKTDTCVLAAMVGRSPNICIFSSGQPRLNVQCMEGLDGFAQDERNSRSAGVSVSDVIDLAERMQNIKMVAEEMRSNGGTPPTDVINQDGANQNAY